ncbi:MAG TPA: SBBP repeat-containing protein [Terriglobales bacterium]|nr:SBBP repeat-containing protein [Terriglobales bacterium]
MRLDHRQSGRTCSPARVLVAIALLMVLGAVALTVGSDAAKLRFANVANSTRLFDSSPVRDTKRVLADYRHLPLIFEPNRGQTDARVRFLARGNGYGLYLTAQEAVLALRHSDSASQGTSAVTMKLVGATSAVEPAGDVELPGKSNYFIGNDPAKWHRDIPQFARVHYRNVYPGIDLVYYGNQGRLEYDFEVASGTDPRIVALKFQGADNLRIDASGDLVVAVGGGNLRLQAPRVYQKFGPEERSVVGRFELRGQQKNEVGFRLGDYDRNRTLIIDPTLTYATYLGGSGDEACSVIAPITIYQIPAPPPGCPAIAVDAAANAYVAGSTTSSNFPQTTGEFQTGLAGHANAFIAKFSPTGTLLFATYLGGDGTDYTTGVAVDTGFDIVVAGTTSSSTFPTTNGSNGSNAAFQTTRVSSGNHVFVSKLDPTATKLLYSTYLSGSGADIASGLALDSGGNAYVTGTTASTEVQTGFPSTVGSYQVAPAAGSTIQFFMSKVNPNLSGTSSVPYSTYFGGASHPGSADLATGGGIAVDSTSNVYITGGTNFTDLPLLNAYQATNKGGLDVFVAKFNPAGVTGTQLLYSTYLGGSLDDIGYAIAVDSTGDAYVTGSTDSSDFSVTGTTATALQPTKGGGTDAFVAKLGVPCTGTSCTTFDIPLDYFSYLGGSGTDVGTAITVDSTSGARITGWTNSPDFPIVGAPLQSTYAGGASDAFFARLDTIATCTPINNPGCTTSTSSTSYFGGTGADSGTSIALDQQGSSYLAGETSSANGFLGHPFQGQLSGNTDAFVSKFAPLLNLTMPAPNPTPLVVGMGSQVTFPYVITNAGEFTNGVTFVDFLPASGVSFVSATASPGTCGAPTNNTVLCNIGTLNAAATATVTVIVAPVAPPLPGGPVSLGNSGQAFVGQSMLASASASVTVNDFKITAAPATATVPAGVPAVFTATVTPSSTSGFPDSVSISCGSGLPTGATCVPGNNNPIPNLNTGPQSSQFVINTTARVTTTTDLRRGGGPGVPLYATWLPVSGLALFGVGLGGQRSRRRRFLVALLLGGLFAMVLFLPGCSSSKTTTTTTGTPAGTYTVTVDAVSGSATRSTVVTLVVQ